MTEATVCPHGHGAEFCPACESERQYAQYGPLGTAIPILTADEPSPRAAKVAQAFRTLLEEIGQRIRADADNQDVDTWAAVEQAGMAVHSLRSVVDYLRGT